MIEQHTNIKIGQKVRKKSGRPFKSGLLVNTVAEIIAHPYRPGKSAFIFDEDDSAVSIENCEAID